MHVPFLALAPFLGFGLLFGAIGAWGLVRDRRLRAGGATTAGVIVAQHSTVGGGGDAGGGDLKQHPVAMFSTRDGRTMRVTSPVGTSDSSFVPGRHVTVDYDPTDPTRFSIRGRGTGVYRLFLAIGVALILGTLVYALLPNRDEFADKLPLGIPVLLGGIFAGIGYYGIRRTWLIKNRGGVAPGVVVGASTSSTRNGLTLHHPVVRYPGPDGNPIDAPSFRGRFARPPVPGTRVEVYYKRTDPNTMLLARDGTAPVFWLFGVIGVIVLLAGIAILVAVLAL